MKMKKTTLLLTLLVAGFAGLCAADVLDVGTATFEGTFEGFEHGLFLFRNANGRLRKEDRSVVRSLEMSKPKEINLLRVGSRDWEGAYLTGYDRFNFRIRQDGKSRTVSGLRVKEISTQTLSAMREAGRQSSGRTKLRSIDTSDIENNPNLNAVQARAFAAYKKAKREYDDFVAESTAMVRRMDTATGSERDELLLSLRRRKTEEQPIAQALGEAQTALLRAFPDGGVPAKTRVRPERTVPKPTPAAPANRKLPKPGKDGVVLIDVSGIQTSPNLNEVQTAALRRYRSATSRYRRAAEKPVTPDTENEYKKAVYESKGALRRAQKALLNAFPEMSFE